MKYYVKLYILQFCTKRPLPTVVDADFVYCTQKIQATQLKKYDGFNKPLQTTLLAAFDLRLGNAGGKTVKSNWIDIDDEMMISEPHSQPLHRKYSTSCDKLVLSLYQTTFRALNNAFFKNCCRCQRVKQIKNFTLFVQKCTNPKKRVTLSNS